MTNEYVTNLIHPSWGPFTPRMPVAVDSLCHQVAMLPPDFSNREATSQVNL